jgi:hypothetical protein
VSARGRPSLRVRGLLSPGQPGEYPQSVNAMSKQTASRRYGVHPHHSVIVRGAKAVELVNAGATYREVATELGVSVGMAHKYVTVALRYMVGRSGGEELLQRELAYLSHLQAKIAPKVDAGDVAAVGVGLRISARRSALLGIDAPTKVQFVPDEVIRNAAEERENKLRLLRGRSEVA